MNDTNVQRQELADFLRTRRARLRPSDVGLLNGTRRRTPGLRREEVALLANIGVTWYTRLEQGAPINVSPGVLTSIADVLQLTDHEREHLFVLSGHRAAEATIAETERVSEVQQRVLDALDPNPAVIRGRRFDVLAWNRAACAIFGDYTAKDVWHRNSIWRFFMDPTARTCMPRSHEAASNVVAQFRAVAAKYLGDPGFQELIDVLLEGSPDFRRHWSQHDVHGTTDGLKHLYHPLVGELRLEYTSLAVPGAPDMYLIAYTTAKGSEEERKLRLVLDSQRELAAPISH
ncbi:MAG TPA: helix-turn-helix transcriptional regulator [Candidatus Baltobacteraceae bacterium]|nr:helix-turn-helix transcriptional regulator [Candidatus Baltobacteraceae bacterium]